MEKLITKPEDVKEITKNEEFFELPPRKNASVYNFVIRIIDLIVSLCVLIFLSPVFIAIALAIYLEDRHSPIFIDTRLGKNKQPFKFYKFRSMMVNASELERNNKEIYAKIRSGTHKIENHPYVTKIGRFLRKSSLDEIPQFINVLKGDMHVVGPRALKIDEEKKFREENPEYTDYINALFEVNPGITGFWQVSGRSKIDFKKRIRMEAYYARTYSVLNDLLIMFKTPFAVFRAETH